MADRIRWGILGNATIARKCVIPAIQKSKIGRVSALATRSPETAAETAKRFDIPKVYGDYDALLDDDEIDAVYIPLPNHLHLPWTLKSLSLGKHVLCEKPLALNAREAMTMKRAADAAHRRLMEAFMYRFHPRSKKIKDMVSSGKIGEPRLVRSAFCYHMDEKVLERGNTIRLKTETGGGALLDTGCYGVSVARWLLGEEPSRVYAEALYHPNGVDIQVTAALFFPKGVFATVESSFMSTLQQTFSVIGSDAAIELPHDAFIPWEKDAIFTVRQRHAEKGEVHTVDGADEYQLMVTHFVEAALGRVGLEIDPLDSIANMRVLDALSLAAKTGKRIELSL